jgi:uncharacterized protein YfbU (UPF0304 family)
MVRTERFEMRLDSKLLEQIDDWRDRHRDQPSRAEAVRQLLEFALAGSLREETQLDRSQRLIVWMLAEILKGQEGNDGRKDVKLIQEAIYGGHLWALDWELVGILHSHTDKQEAVNLVVDTLDMWTFIERAFSELSQADKEKLEAEVPILGKNPMFAGFDGNHESEYMGIARFLIEQMGRFENFKGRRLNSHMPKVQRYSQMLQSFEPIRAKLIGREMSVDELIIVLKRE